LNAGSSIYVPDRGSRQAYERYLRYSWPGGAVVIDDEQPGPRLNPPRGGPGLPSPAGAT
jgi:hypothetical protein